MKRFLRLCACLLTAAVLCATLCGCDALDEARANHGFWTEAGSVRLGEAEYLVLPVCAELQPIQTEWQEVSVTQPEVPVLVKDLFGQQMAKSDDGLFLTPYDARQSFCRADKYEEICRRIEEGPDLSGYCYLYSPYDPKEDTFVDEYYSLTAEQVAAVNTVYQSVEPTVLPYSTEFYWDNMVYLEHCSKDLLFRRDAMEIYFMDNAFYLLKGHYYDRTDTAETVSLYKVPEEYRTVFTAIMAKQVEADAYWEAY